MSREKAIIKHPAYDIKPARITRKEALTDREQFFEIRFNSGEYLDHDPGQFVEVSIFGVGEAPISVCSSPHAPGKLRIMRQEDRQGHLDPA